MAREPTGPRVESTSADPTPGHAGGLASQDDGDGQRAGAPPSGKAFLAQLGRRGRAGAADYVYQIIIVILGVFLGITFESMASERDQTQKAYTALEQLVADMRRDDADMRRIIEQQRGQALDFGEIASWLSETTETRSARIDSLLEKVVTSLTVYPRRGAYTSMIAAGQIALLPEDLAASIANLYENVYSRLSANGEHYDFSLERDFLPAYAHSWDPARQVLIVADARERVRFRNHLLLMRAWSDYYSDLLAHSQAALQEVISAIDEVRASE